MGEPMLSVWTWSRSLRIWLVALLPALAIMLAAVARPTTLSLYATHALAWGLAPIGALLSPFLWRRFGAGPVGFALATLLTMVLLPGLHGSRYQKQWETLNGPGIDEPGPFRVHRFNEVDALVLTPWIALGIGGATYLVFDRLRIAPSAFVFWALVFFVIAVFILLLLPAVQSARRAS